MNYDRPWSPSEVEAKIVGGIEKLHDAVRELRGYGVAAAQSEWSYRQAMAQCQVKSEGRNAEERNAQAVLLLCEMRSPMAGWERYHPGITRDLARNAYSDQRAVVAACSDDLGALRSLLKSARNGDG